MTLVERIVAKANPLGRQDDRLRDPHALRNPDGRAAALAARGRTVKTLISYGSSWFPWYMRRLAERPANVWFVAKSMFQR